MTIMGNTKDYYYDLPERYIAQEPMDKRDNSRLMILDRKTGIIEHRMFSDIVDYLNEGDILVLNDSRVIPARLFGHREAKDESIEVLLADPLANELWQVMARPGKKLKIGTKVFFSDDLSCEVVDINQDGTRNVKFNFDGDFYKVLDEIGNMPLPPYITKKLYDRERYQTVYNHFPGSVAAPTAGLHFTEELLRKIEDKGVQIAYITLHVGLGTFLPVKVEDIEKHVMHTEFYNVSKATADRINEVKDRGGKVVSIGTTTTRTLESIADENGRLTEMTGKTDIFIYPGYNFKIVDSLCTNFHLPESTLLMLVSAFYSREKIMNAYEVAIAEDYRFYSFGDAMLIL